MTPNFPGTAAATAPAAAPHTDDHPDATGAHDAALGVARRVLELESAALLALIETVECPAFASALDAIMACEGRIVVTGIGKSGHIGRKMAATFASTGTPSFYIHPTEASHGDLGMIAHNDVVVALSNSGNTMELADILAFSRRYGLPLVGITSGRDSTLGQYSDHLLVLPEEPEACPHGLAPTTSTTMMLALGDALAIALLERRGFTRDDYRILHPGGALGRRLKRVSDLMHTGDDLPLLPRHASVGEAILVMTAKSFGCVGLTETDGRLAGIITDGDLRRHMGRLGTDAASGDPLLTQSADKIMTAQPRTIRPDALMEEGLQQMNAKQITSLFVLDENGRPRGILHIHDCLRAGLT